MKVLTVLIGLFASYALSAFSQTFPDRPVHMLLPQIPGGTSDVLGRLLAQKLGEKWGQTIVVEYKPGAAGNIGTDAVARSAPNGYTWLFQYVGAHAINPTLFKTLPFDPVKDFTPVATVASGPFVLVASNALPVKNMREFIEYARANPGRVNYGAQVGSVNHLLGQLMNSSAGVKTVWVPYRGAADSLTNTISGELQYNIGSAGAVASFVKAGKVRALATSGSRRSAAFSEVPTMAESGFPALTVDAWWGILLPAGVPAGIVRKINSDVNAVLTVPELVERFRAIGTEPYALTPEQFAKIFRDDIVKWGAIVTQSGVPRIE